MSVDSSVIVMTDGTLQATVTAAMAGSTVQMAGAQALTSDFTIPVDVALDVSSSQPIVLNGHTLIWNGPLIGQSLTELFRGSGTVQWGNRAVNKVRPEWHGSGKTDDDATAINKAVAALPSSGGVLELGPRNYPMISSGLNLAGKNDIRIEGSGDNTTQLIMNAAGITLINLSGTCTRIKLAGLWLGSYTAQTDGRGISAIGTQKVHSDQLLIEHCTLQNLPYPLMLAYFDLLRIYNVRIVQSLTGPNGAPSIVGSGLTMHDVVTASLRDVSVSALVGMIGADCVTVDYNCDTVVLDTVAVDHAALCGFRFAQTVTAGTTGPRLVRAQNCYSESNMQHGFLVSGGRIVRLNSCHAAVNQQSGYVLAGGDDVEIDGGDAAVNGQHGCALLGGTGLGVLKLHALTNSTTVRGTHDGINIAGTVQHARIKDCVSGNYVYSPATQRYGIAAAAGADHLWITGNDVKDKGNLTAGEGDFSGGIHNKWDNF